MTVSKQCAPEFKSKIVLEIFREEKTFSELSPKYGIHPSQLRCWKKEVSEEFAEALLREEKVALVPGNAFGPSGEGHVRLSYASSLDDLGEALRRMARFVKKRGVQVRAVVNM